MRKTLAALPLFLFAVSSSAFAVPIIGGITEVEFNDTFLSLGLNVTANLPATLTGATATFPITGVDTEPLLITHVGSLSISNGVNTLTIGNFSIDGPLAQMLGDVDGGPTQAALFNLETGLQLSITQLTADSFNGLFGTNLQEGIIIATADPQLIVQEPSAVPEPSSALLIGLGVAGLALLSRRAA